MLIALASLEQHWEDKEANLRRCRALAQRATTLDAALIVFPEMTLTGFTMNATSIAEDPVASPTIRSFAALAAEFRIHAAFGVVLQGRHRPQNCLVVVDRDGAELARYAKLHPFSHAQEHAHYEPGSELASAHIHNVKFGLTICYDLRFPELYSALAATCDALIVIANWPETRIQHWRTLLAARAIDAQSYVIGVNRTGEDGNGIRYPRSSTVVDPRGAIVTPLTCDGEIELFALEPAVVAASRQAFPTLRDRRPELYRSWF